MPKSKLVLMAATDAVEGPWINVNGQTGMDVLIRGLSHGDFIRFEYEVDESDSSIVSRGLSFFEDCTGHYVDTKDWLRYRATKRIMEGSRGKSSTFVEVFPR